MSDTNTSSSSSAPSAFILGGLVVAIGVIAWAVFGGGFTTDEPDISITVPGVGSVEGEVTEN